MISVTDVADVADSLGRSINPPEDDQVQAWINRVEGRIANRISDLDEQLQDTGFKATFIGVVVDVVIRRINNPKGMQSERIDDYYYDRRGSDKADLWPSESEWAELLPTLGTGAFSTRPGFERGGRQYPWT